MSIRFLALFLAIAAGFVSPSAGSQTATPPALRLPDTVRPTHYSVELRIIPSEDRFRGAIDIALDVTKPTNIIWLNARYLKLELARIEGIGVPAQASIVDGGEDFVGLQFDRALAAGNATLHIEYTGEINKKDTSGVFALRERGDWYAFSQFEPTRARRAFPCFDEPSYKVPWQLNLLVRTQDAAVSNTPIASETPQPGGMKRIAFAQTMPLPSYLVAFGVGPFEFVDAGTAGMKRTPLRIVTPKGMQAQARYPARVTARILELEEQYTGVPYPYEKLDNLAMTTVNFGAMENAGLITWGMPLLLANADAETDRFKQTYARIAAHEIGHMWFGDLVTHAWWDDIWLNESFATWIAAKISDRLDPSWEVKSGAILARDEAMANDSLASARKIRQPIENNGDILNAFDSITYAKGGAVLSMFESWMGEQRFREAVQRYLAKYEQGNATAADFLAQLSARGNEQVGPAFATFLDQPGVPLVSMRLQCGPGAAELQLAQRRYLPLGSAAVGASTWRVPVCVGYTAQGKAQRACTLMRDGAAVLPLGAACPTSLQAGTARYYRAQYQGDRLQSIARPQTSAEIVAFIGDTDALAHNGSMSLEHALEAVQPFAESTDWHVAQALVEMIARMRPLVPEARREDAARWIRKLFGRRARSLGFALRPEETEGARQLRPILIRLLADAGDDGELGTQAVALAKRWLQDRRAVDGSMVQAVLESAARHGGRELFEQFRNEVRGTQDRRERRYLFAALGSFRDPALADAALGLMLNDDYDVREATQVAWTLADDSRGSALAYAFMKRNFDTLVARSPRNAAAHFPSWGAQLCDDVRRADMSAFFQGRIGAYEGGPRVLAQTLETIKLCAAFKDAQQASLGDFLRRSAN